jgi:broad specificity phosphatase PhoE
MTDDSAEVWIVRHGQTEWSAAGRHTSHSDVPLTPEGEAAARELAGRLAGVDFALVLTSPRIRARRTAELAGFANAHVEVDLAEWDYGEYEGLTTAQIREHAPGWTVWSQPCPGGESPQDVGRRLDRVVAKARAQGGRVLLFGHGHSSRVLAMRWLGRPVAEGRLLRLDPTTISVLGYEHEDPAVARWNC